MFAFCHQVFREHRVYAVGNGDGINALLVDECTGPGVAQWLRAREHEIFSVFDEARGMDDDDIITKAFVENWILITNDKDFGEKVYREGRPHRGVVFLRLEDERTVVKIATIRRLLDGHAEQMHDRFVVVTETKIRFTKKIEFPN